MTWRPAGVVLAAGLILTAAACNPGSSGSAAPEQSVQSGSPVVDWATPGMQSAGQPGSGRVAPAESLAAASSVAATTVATSGPGTSTAPSTSTTSTSSTTTTSTTTLPPVPPGVHNPECVRVVRPNDALSVIVDELATEGISVETLRAENGIGGDGLIHPGQLLDICVANAVNDITGERRGGPAADLVDESHRSGVEAQQEKLNALFAGTGLSELAVDGISGPATRRALCAARLALGLPVERTDMEPGSEEERVLLAATGLPIPPSATTVATKWALVDLTCQIFIAGESANTVEFVFPTSTGEPGYETRPQYGSPAFRYNPAIDTDGWHNSLDYPVPEDNPLNGNMYKPIYFDNGQAIHGSYNVTPEPRSKGCVRLRVGDHDRLVAWLGLGDTRAPLWNPNGIGLTVRVQGSY